MLSKLTQLYRNWKENDVNQIELKYLIPQIRDRIIGGYHYFHRYSPIVTLPVPEIAQLIACMQHTC